MIEMINDLCGFDAYCKTDIYSVKIKSLLKTYGCKYSFAVFYRQVNEDKKITAVLSKLDNDFTLSFTEESNVEELSQFFKIIGYSSLLSDSCFQMNENYSEGAVMVTGIKKEIHASGIVINRYPKLLDLFNLVDYDSVDFESWYVDLSHRIRHNCACAATAEMDGIPVSSAILSSIYNDDAVLTAVQTIPDYRKKGYASALVSEMICDIKGSVFIMREENKNESFYKNIGFINCGKWRMYK